MLRTALELAEIASPLCTCSVVGKSDFQTSVTVDLCFWETAVSRRVNEQKKSTGSTTWPPWFLGCGAGTPGGVSRLQDGESRVWSLAEKLVPVTALICASSWRTIGLCSIRLQWLDRVWFLGLKMRPLQSLLAVPIAHYSDIRATFECRKTGLKWNP